ncbi:MAG: prepilin-type N-terminal cleavage/methylation domain-containing protein [Gemmatimonadaceae bacterium]
MRYRVKGHKGASLGSDREGMSIVELLVAMVLLSVGLLGLAMLSIRLSKQHDGAGSQQLAALVVQSRFDSLASIHCQNLAQYGAQSGTVTTRGITERWAIVDGNDIKTITDTVTFAARKLPLAYVSVIPCRD